MTNNTINNEEKILIFEVPLCIKLQQEACSNLIQITNGLFIKNKRVGIFSKETYQALCKISGAH